MLQRLAGNTRAAANEEVMSNRRGGHNLNMTEGKIGSLLVTFALPLLLGNVFQQMYNMVDAWVVGNYVNREAFAAVGTVGPIVNTLISLYLGISSGAGVVISQNYGARRDEAASRAIHTAVMMTIITAAVLSLTGIAFRDTFLRLMNTPEEVMPDAGRYLLILFSGMGFMMLYNIGAAALQAIGDSTKPFYFLTAATVVNISGDLIFVLHFHMGVEGVALATVLAMAVSAALVLTELMRSRTCIRLSFRKLRIDLPTLRQIIRIGIPAALEMGVISFSNILVQRYINSFGAVAMSGWTAYIKIDGLMMLPMQSLALSASTFVGQNIGMGKEERARRGVRTAVKMSFIITIGVAVPVCIFASGLVGFFNPDAEVIRTGATILRSMSPFYIFICSANIQTAGLRGSGDSRTPMLITVFSYVIVRQVYLYTMTHFISNTLIPVCLGYPAGWIVCTIIVTVYYSHAELGKRSVTGVGKSSHSDIPEEAAAEIKGDRKE